MNICPELQLISRNNDKYKKYSHIFKQIISDYDSNFESNSLDSAYLDLTSYLTNIQIDFIDEQGIFKFVNEIGTIIYE